ncbi:MAG TPA: PAS domain S-box protein [Baekduia sp.]|nr:PAS domain S-box protein [Baekduia sp.]HET6506470.1 PAS domain S-box protein [Baekduia sp.]
MTSREDAPDPADTTGTARRAHELALLVDTIRDYAIFLLDEQGTIVTWNAGAERLKGYTSREIVGRHFSTFYPEEDRAAGRPARILETARAEGRYEEEGWRVRRDGSRFWASVVITAIRDEGGRLLGFGKVTRDLTRRRLDEQHLRDNAAVLAAANDELQQFRRMVLGVRDYAIFLLDPGGRITTWNAGAERIKGYTAEEIVGRHFSTFYTDADRAREHPAEELRIASTAGRYEEEGWRVRKDGTHFWANVVITALRDEDGVLLGFSKVTRDLTERRAADEALQEANERLARSNQELDRFASVAAHDLQEPLRTISGFAELLRDRYADALDDAGRSYLGHVSSAAVRMSRLVDDLLGYARAAAEPRHDGAETVVADAVEVVLAELRATIAERGTAVFVDVPDGARVLAEPRDVEAALRNLLSNAVKFASAEEPRVAVTAEAVEGSFRVAVLDNGIGIDPADRPRLFVPFARLHSASEYEGTGLGLAIAQRVVERNGGAIGVDSTVGEGSRFWFTLPAGVAAVG